MLSEMPMGILDNISIYLLSMLNYRVQAVGLSTDILHPSQSSEVRVSGVGHGRFGGEAL